MQTLSHSPYERFMARRRRIATVIWAAFLAFIFFVGIVSRIWLR
jgi:hypothetical protein